jgi:hypothetical protein
VDERIDVAVDCESCRVPMVPAKVRGWLRCPRCRATEPDPLGDKRPRDEIPAYEYLKAAEAPRLPGF